jgi:hypothetical protein
MKPGKNRATLSGVKATIARPAAAYLVRYLTVVFGREA